MGYSTYQWSCNGPQFEKQWFILQSQKDLQGFPPEDNLIQ